MRLLDLGSTWHRIGNDKSASAAESGPDAPALKHSETYPPALTGGPFLRAVICSRLFKILRYFTDVYMTRPQLRGSAERPIQGLVNE